MAAKILRAFDLASSDVREQIILGIAERLNDDELGCFQTALQRLERRFDILCGVSKTSGAQLPHEIQLQIVDLLDISDIYYCTNVCRKWRCLLLQCEQLTDDLLKKWFPAFFEDDHKSSERLHQIIRRRHLRDTGRFRTRQVHLLPPLYGRFTCGFIKDSNGSFPVDRIEGLQRGRIFKDLTCSASRDVSPPISPQSHMGALLRADSASRGGSDNIVSKYLYADGRLALQLTPAPGEWVNSLIVHDFHEHKRWNLSLPSMRTRGIKLALWALGPDLVVARVVGERDIYAWDLRSHVSDRVVLSSTPYRCFTKHRSVVMVTVSGKLLFWSFGGDLVDIDMAVPQDEGDYRGPARPECIPRAPLTAYERQNLIIMFHPGDEDVFFMATFDDRVLEPDVFLLLWVYEFRNNRCCRIFTYSVSPERRHWIVFGAHEVDAHGTYQLLEQENRADDGVHVSCVTFNTISKSFGALRFQVPVNADQDISFVWNDHLVLRQASSEESRVRPCPLVALGRPPDPQGLGAGPDILFEGQTHERAMENMMKSAVSPTLASRDALSAAMKASEQRNSKYDIVRAQDVSPSTSPVGAGIGLRYMLSSLGGYCNWEGLHVNGCPKSSGLQSSDGYLYPLNFSEDSLTACGTAKGILGDDNFLVVINSRGYYTVFAVDEDGKMAEAMRDGASHNAGMSRKAPEVTGS